MVVSFLQMHPRPPEHQRNLGVLLIEFFELYGLEFHYERVGISVQHQGSYFLKDERGWVEDRRPYLLSVENPRSPEDDVSRNS
jgi:non-canonical poly(A) RNA polymerase PAPD5/7